MVSWQDGQATRVLRCRCAISSAHAGRGCPGLPRSASLRTWCTRTPGMITNMMITTPPDTLGQTVSRKVSQSQFLVAAVTDSDSCGTCLRSHHAGKRRLMYWQMTSHVSAAFLPPPCQRGISPEMLRPSWFLGSRRSLLDT